MLSFRSLESIDLPRLFEWLQRSHVKTWWDDGEDTLDKVTLKYGPLSDEENVDRFVLIWSSRDEEA